MRTLIVALMLAGCGPMSAESDGGSLADAGACVGAAREALSGTRLRARYVEGDDGSRSPLGFFDTMRSEACAFSRAEDGLTRCLPTEDLLIAPVGLFLDPLCRQAVAVGSCALARYAVTPTPTCPTRSLLFEVGAPIVPPTLYTNTTGACVATPASPDQVYRPITRAVPPSHWVLGTVKIDL